MHKIKENNTRTCVFCRKSGDRSRFLRFVRVLDGEVIFDEKGSLPFRGAWLCPKKYCIRKGFAKNSLFKGQAVVKTNIEQILQNIEVCFNKKILSYFGLLRKMGMTFLGRDQALGVASLE